MVFTNILKDKKMLRCNAKQWGKQHTKFHNQHIFSYVNVYANKRGECIIFGRFLAQFSTFLDFSNYFYGLKKIKFICNYYFNSCFVCKSFLHGYTKDNV